MLNLIPASNVIGLSSHLCRIHHSVSRVATSFMIFLSLCVFTVIIISVIVRIVARVQAISKIHQKVRIVSTRFSTVDVPHS